MPAVFGIVELDASQVLRIILESLRGGQYDGLIAAQSRGRIHGARVDATKEQIGFATNDEERLRLMQGEPAGEVGEAAIHDVKAASFWNHDIEHIDLVHLAVGDVDESWNVAAQVEQRMHLDRSFGLAEMGPREDAQAQVDGGCVERVDGLLQLYGEAVLGIEFARQFDLAERKIPIDTPVAGFVGIGEGTLGDVATNAQVVELGLMCAQAGFDIAQALAVSQLRESQAKKLIEVRECKRWISTRIFGHALTECV